MHVAAARPETLDISQVDPAACEYRTKPFGYDSGIRATIETPVPRVKALMDAEMARSSR